jgi:hypothetical protein
VAKKKTKFSNAERYLKRLIEDVPKVMPTILAEVAWGTYQEVLQATVVDSGQAMYHWNMTLNGVAPPRFRSMKGEAPVGGSGYNKTKTDSGFYEENSYDNKENVWAFKIAQGEPIYAKVLRSRGGITSVQVVNSTPSQTATTYDGQDYRVNAELDQPWDIDRHRRAAFAVAKAKFPHLLSGKRGPYRK